MTQEINTPTRLTRAFWRARRHLLYLATGALGLALAMVVILAAADGPVSAEDELRDRLRQVPTGQDMSAGHFQRKVTAAEFADVGGGTGLYRYNRFSGYMFPFDRDTADGKVEEVCLRAPVYLPDGITLNGFSAYVLDEDTDADINRIELRRAPYRSTAGTDLMASTFTTGGGNPEDPEGIQVLEAPSVAFPEVDNALYSYFALVCMDGTEKGETLRLYTLAVAYGGSTFLPMMQK